MNQSECPISEDIRGVMNVYPSIILMMLAKREGELMGRDLTATVKNKNLSCLNEKMWTGREIRKKRGTVGYGI